MEKETKVIKERVKTAENAAKIERVAAAKVEEEIGEELMPLKSQLSAIQTTLNQLESSRQQNMNSSCWAESTTTKSTFTTNATF